MPQATTLGYMNLRSELRGKAVRDSREILLPTTKSAMGQSTFKYAAGKEWNRKCGKFL